MVQAAAQAQAVVAAAKSRGDGLVPMNAAQIAALSQIQAQAIVHARKTNNNNTASGSGNNKNSSQIQTQIQLQAQALVHAHTQAQIAAGIYKGDDGAAGATSGNTSGAAAKTAAVAMEQDDTAVAMDISKTAATSSTNIVAPSSIPPSILPPPSSSNNTHMMDTSTSAATSSNSLVPQAPAPSSSSPQFLAQLNSSLNSFWKDQLHMVHELPPSQTEQDFKTHNDLPLARIKRIMKSDEDVRMISAEAPVLFAKACELFILDLSIRSWNYSQLHKRRTLQKEDIREAIQKTDIFDFLVDVI